MWENEGLDKPIVEEKFGVDVPDRTRLILPLSHSNDEFERSLSEVLSEVLSEKDITKLKPIIDYLETHDGISPQTAKLLINKSEATVRRYLRILVESGLVVKQGNTNNVVYVKQN